MEVLTRRGENPGLHFGQREKPVAGRQWTLRFKPHIAAAHTRGQVVGDLRLGVQIRPTEHMTINIEGGIRTLPFFGVSAAMFF